MSDQDEPLDYIGIHPKCGCITFVCSGKRPIDRKMSNEMAAMVMDGLEIRRVRFEGEIRAAFRRCTHRENPDV